jgi:1-acyl-sn-glycerol-3-phosphate acyltransferase
MEPLRLDGFAGAEIPSVGPEKIALGRDPFADGPEIDPLLDRLDLLGGPFAPERRTARDLLGAASGPKLRVGTGAPRRRRRTTARAPRLKDVVSPPPRDWIDRLLGADERRRMAALAKLVGPGAQRDRFGLSPEAVRRALPFFEAIYRRWFRVQSQGHEHLPVDGPGILAANHAGLLPFDGAMTVLDVVLHTDPPRLPRALVDRFVGRLPWVRDFFASVGQVVGTRALFGELLDDGQLVLVFPEGMDGIKKPIAQRYRLQGFRPGLVELSLRHGAPIVPMAIAGSDDQAPILFDLAPLARRLGLPFLPVTPTFPWLGPLGLLPYPVRYRIVYGEPFAFHERYGPDAADDPRLVRYLTQQVRSTVQRLLDGQR